MSYIRKISAIVLMVIFIAIVVVACRKLGSEDNTQIEFTVADAEKWYSKNEIANVLNKARSNGPQTLTKVLWNKGRVRKAGDMEIIEVPYFSNHTEFTLPKLVGCTKEDMTKIALATVNTLVIMKRDGKVYAVKRQYCPDLHYLKAERGNIRAIDSLPKRNFTGDLVIKRLNDNFLLFERMKDNKGVKLLKPKRASSSSKVTTNATGCETLEYCNYFFDCCYVVFNCFGSPPNNCQLISGGGCQTEEVCSDPCWDSADPEWCDCIYYNNCESWNEMNGGHSQLNSELNDHCLTAAYERALAAQFQNKVKILQFQLFGDSRWLKITIAESASLTSGELANSTCTIVGDLLNIRVTLNVNELPNSTLEFTAATIFREAFLAYLIADGKLQEFNQDNDNTTTYTTWLKEELIEAFPNLNQAQADALAWGGFLVQSGAYGDFTNAQRLYITEMNNNHKIAAPTYGTQCN